jgi:RecA-family ATPase
MREHDRLSQLTEQGAALSLQGLEQALGVAVESIATLDWQRLAGIPPQAKTFIIPKLAPAGEVTLFTGAGSAGKSLLAQQLATALAAGVPTLGIEMGQAPAVYITCEDDEEQLHFRQARICQALGVPMASLAGELAVASLRGALDNALGMAGPDGEFVLSASYHRIAALIRKTGAKLAALDNVAHLFPGNENDRGEVTRFVNLLNRLAGETGAAILLLGHPNKSGDTYSGSTAWLNAVRSQFVIEHDQNTDIRTLTVGKANYSRKGEQIRFVWVEGAFVLEGDLPPDTAARLADTARAQAENAAFLACLRAREAQGEGRLVGPNSGPNYAPAQFEGMPEAKGLQRDRLKAAMNRLFATGAIETFSYHKKAKARDVTIIREVPRTPSRTDPDHFPNGTPITARSPP